MPILKMELLSPYEPKVTIQSSDTMTVNLISLKSGTTTERMATLKITAEDQLIPCKREITTNSLPLIVRSEGTRPNRHKGPNIQQKILMNNQHSCMPSVPAENPSKVQVPIDKTVINEQKKQPADSAGYQEVLHEILIYFELFSSLIRTCVYNQKLKKRLLHDINHAKTHLSNWRMEKTNLILKLIFHEIQLILDSLSAGKKSINLALLRVITSLERRLLELTLTPSTGS